MLSVRAGERKDFSEEKVLILSSVYPPLPRVLAGVISEHRSAKVEAWAPWGCPAYRHWTGALHDLYSLGEFIQDLDMGVKQLQEDGGCDQCFLFFGPYWAQ